MSKASQETTTSAPSENNPPIKFTFFLKMKPLHKLRLAIETLADPSFNDDGFGMVWADKNGFGLTVTNASKVTAFVLLKPSGMIRFRIYKPMVGKLVPLQFISHGFPNYADGDDDTVCIYHVHGSNELHFDFGTIRRSGIWAEFVVIPPVNLFYPAKFLFRTILPLNDMREMIDCVLQEQGVCNGTVSVLVEMKHNFVKFEIGSNKKKWEYDNSHNRMRGLKGVKDGQIHKTMFNWSYTRLMKKASFLADEFRMHFAKVPKEYIMFQFCMGELGDLGFMKKALLVVPDIQQRTPGNRKQSDEMSEKRVLDTPSSSCSNWTQ